MREPLFSVTRKDFVITATKGSGPGGQHRNKTSSAIRIEHPASGAVGYSESHKSQHANKKAALQRLMATPEWQQWLRIESARRQVGRSGGGRMNTLASLLIPIVCTALLLVVGFVVGVSAGVSSIVDSLEAGHVHYCDDGQDIVKLRFKLGPFSYERQVKPLAREGE